MSTNSAESFSGFVTHNSFLLFILQNIDQN